MMGGYGSALYSVCVAVVAFVFQRSFLKSVSKTIAKIHYNRFYTIQEIQDKLISRISYVSLYVLHDRVALLEEKHLFPEDSQCN